MRADGVPSDLTPTARLPLLNCAAHDETITRRGSSLREESAGDERRLVRLAEARIGEKEISEFVVTSARAGLPS
jgi:hypothetical protein